MPKDIQGIAASDGVGIAPAYLLTTPDLSFKKRRVADPEQEYRRVKAAFTASIADLQRIKQNARKRLSDKELDVLMPISPFFPTLKCSARSRVKSMPSR